VAGVAGDSTVAVLTVEIRFIYLLYHRDHFPGRALHFLIVFFTIDLSGHSDVAVNALHTERIGHEMHRRLQLVGGQIFQDLNILELLGRSFHRFGLCGPPGRIYTRDCTRSDKREH